MKSTEMSAATYVVPVVVHILHQGDALGDGYNFPAERIINQIRTLNEDYRRKTGTPGFNTNPDGGDTRIQFVLAQIDPNGNLTDGIDRVDMTTIKIGPSDGDIITTCSKFSYWDPEQYLNIWSFPTGLPPGLLLGSARFPLSDLEGLPKDMPAGDGVFISALNFGTGDTNFDPEYNMGRTLTHEIGHFFGLLHTFGTCGQYTDYCEDTPPAGSATSGCPATKPLSCDGRPVMTENYMDYSLDRCMNIFTNEQISRMRTVLENSPHRKSLLTSRALGALEVPDKNLVVSVYPNPATDKIYISTDEKIREQNVHVSAHSLLGKLVFEGNYTATTNAIELRVADVREKVIILTIESQQSFTRKLILLH
ncbi:hypothetical protein WSM22_36640 [Cytophagales bacterium WSM2-2]|nr:hypothetical protein WSM22_36640 [Cytophagales bacterium WSM2-2]